jgi:hypothetical protein
MSSVIISMDAGRISLTSDPAGSILSPVSDTATIPESSITVDHVVLLRSLRKELLSIQQRIRELAGPLALVERSTVDCLRCGFTWTPYNPFVPPVSCARCGTTAWNRPPTATSRRPGDPPAPSWRRRKGTRRPKFRVYVEAPSAPVTMTIASPAPSPTIEPRFVPPSVRHALPPPPSPSMSGPTLSERFAALRTEGPMVRMADGNLHPRDETNLREIESPAPPPAPEIEETPPEPPTELPTEPGLQPVAEEISSDE